LLSFSAGGCGATPAPHCAGSHGSTPDRSTPPPAVLPHDRRRGPASRHPAYSPGSSDPRSRSPSEELWSLRPPRCVVPGTEARRSSVKRPAEVVTPPARVNRGIQNMHKSRIVVAVGVVCTALVAPAIAGAATVSGPIADGFAGPLQIAVGATGRVYVAQDFAGVLSQIGKKGAVSDLVSAPGTEIAGVAALGNGTVFYTTAIGATEESPPTSTLLRRVLPNGHVSTLADLRSYEQ